MDIRTLLLLALVGVCFAAQAGSGDGENTLIIDDEEDDDIYLAGEGSGRLQEDKDMVEGSGTEPPSTTVTLPSNVRCDMNRKCWCVYTDGSEVPGTRNTGLPSCSQFKDKPTTTELPRRTKPTDPPVQPIEQTEETATEENDIIDIDGGDLGDGKPDVILAEKSTVKPTQRYNNEITNAPPIKVSNIDEDMEELTNEISGGSARQQVNDEAVRTERLTSFSFSHPGIMAAIIGGGVVGLLCAILLVMFIIYRMRKKDEGSYPLDDSKPLKNYAYAKAPSREFYA